MKAPVLPLPDSFPSPDEQAAALSGALLAEIVREIDRCGGVIPFDRYMEMTLYLPGLGYYSNGTRKFGSAGDFVTAPEISPFFGRCVARSVAPVIAGLPHADMLELGAGSGVFAVDVLRELQDLGELPARYLILELSGELRQRQQQRFAAEIPDLLERIHWLERLPEQPLRGVIFGNEVVDALPVKRFRWSESAVVEQGVSYTGGLALADRVPEDRAFIDQLEQLSRSRSWQGVYTSEWCPSLPAWTRSLAGILDQGALLLIDYGCGRDEYYHAQRNGGSLMCHYRHRAHQDPLILPGLQDITAYVDFSALAESGCQAGLELAGYCTQAHFLLDNGLETLLAGLDASDQAAFFRRVSEIKTLTLPGEMGERFKVMALTRNSAVKPGGFASQDLRSRL